MATPAPTPGPGQYGENSVNLPPSQTSAGTNPALYTYSPNGTGGLNYFYDGKPITNTVYGMATGNDYATAEAKALADFNASKQTGGGGGTGGGGTGGGNTLTQAQIDAAKMAGYNSQKGSILDSAQTSIDSSANEYNNGIIDFIHSLDKGQQTINNKGVQSELSKAQGRRNVLDMVSGGVQSGRVMLANKNASDSSASEALARAYATLGQKQMSGVDTQYGQDQNAISQDQAEQDYQMRTGVQRLQNNKANVINNIVNAAHNSLAALDAQIASASLPDRINIEAEKSAIRSRAIAQLQQYDEQLNTGVAAIKPSDVNNRVTEANRLAGTGLAADKAYSTAGASPTTFQSSGGTFDSSLPLFTIAGNKNKNVA